MCVNDLPAIEHSALTTCKASTLSARSPTAPTNACSGEALADAAMAKPLRAIIPPTVAIPPSTF